MKSILDKNLRDEILVRISSIPDDSTATAAWGKMSLYQMVNHCVIWEAWIHGKNRPVYKQAFIGWVFGKMALKGILKDDSPLKRNMPAGDGFSIKERDGTIRPYKEQWIALVQNYTAYDNPGFIHDFFGKMTEEQIGVLAYKHNDHHLRQFGF